MFRLAGVASRSMLNAQHNIYHTTMSADAQGWSQQEELEALLAAPEELVIFANDEEDVTASAKSSTCNCCKQDRERCANPVDISLFLLLSLLPSSVSYARLLVARIGINLIFDAVLWLTFVWSNNVSAKVSLLAPTALLLPLGAFMLCADIAEWPFAGIPLKWWLFGFFKLTSFIVSLIFLAKVYIAGHFIFELELLNAKLDACSLFLLPLWLCRNQRTSNLSTAPHADHSTSLLRT